MEKILSISVAAYNVEKYLENLIESVVQSKYIDKIELLIINDGSKDSTLKIAETYANRFPKSVFAIDKKNGNYGSTVNKAISIATGKYFKLLDGDDWYNTHDLDKLIDTLEKNDIDLAVTNYTQVIEGGGKVSSKVEGVEFGKIYQFSEVRLPNLGMWSLTYKTELLRQCDLKLPTGISYTDMIYSVYPMSIVSSVIILDFDVYQYRIGRDGQTVSPASVIKSIDQLLQVNYELIDFMVNNISIQNKEYLENRVAQYFILTEKALLLDINSDFYRKFKSFDSKIKHHLPSIYLKMSNTSSLKIVKVLNIIKKFGYWTYWILLFLPRLKRWI
ncbi:glycosyltransferase family 2 protein [Streptococcus suis]|nr:glycosyltransferase family 2 protein [Streptococcus suis]